MPQPDWEAEKLPLKKRAATAEEKPRKFNPIKPANPNLHPQPAARGIEPLEEKTPREFQPSEMELSVIQHVQEKEADMSNSIFQQDEEEMKEISPTESGRPSNVTSESYTPPMQQKHADEEEEEHTQSNPPPMDMSSQDDQGVYYSRSQQQYHAPTYQPKQPSATGSYYMGKSFYRRNFAQQNNPRSFEFGPHRRVNYQQDLNFRHNEPGYKQNR